MDTIDPETEYEALRAFDRDVTAMLRWPEARLFGVTADVSEWAPAGHLYHLSIVKDRACKAILRLSRGHPSASGEEEGLNAVGRMVLQRGRFPRGRAQAPPFATPPGDLDRQALEQELARSQRTCEAVERHVPNVSTREGRIAHPVLGRLNAAEWLRFARVHTEHHLAIIHDIAVANDPD